MYCSPFRLGLVTRGIEGGKRGVYEVVSCYRHSEEPSEPNDKWRFVSTNGEGDFEFDVRDKDVVNFFNSD